MKKPSPDSRKRWLVDSKVQKAIAARMVVYWAFGLLFIVLPTALMQSIKYPNINFVEHLGNVFETHWPVLLSLTILLPFAIYDVIKFSNRFAGPIFRIRQEFKRFDEDGKIRAITFRDNDFWHDLSVGVNQLVGRIDELEETIELELEQDSIPQ